MIFCTIPIIYWSVCRIKSVRNPSAGFIDTPMGSDGEDHSTGDEKLAFCLEWDIWTGSFFFFCGMVIPYHQLYSLVVSL